MTTEEQNKFRKTKAWKEFREKIINQQKIDPLTGRPLRKRANLHHLDSIHYDDLDPDKFIALNIQSHDVVHYLDRCKDIDKAIENLKSILKSMELYRNKKPAISSG
jgi:hypothetical protein